MSKKNIALLLAVSMLAALLSACVATPVPDDQSPAPDETTTAASTEQPTSPEPPADTPAPSEPSEKQDDKPDIDIASGAEDAPETILSQSGAVDTPISFPLDETLTLSVFLGGPSMLCPVINSWSEHIGGIQIEEKTNVHLVFTESAGMDSTQLNLLIASGDFTDIIMGIDDGFAGGLVKAYEEEVIIDLKPLAAEYAPNFLAKAESIETLRKAIYTDDGQILGVPAIDDDFVPNGGNFMRKDWLDQLGLDVPQTFDELTEALLAIKVEFNPERPLQFTGNMSGSASDIWALTGGYGITERLYVEDGVIKYGVLQDIYRDYLNVLIDWYKEGILYSDFFVSEMTPPPAVVANAVAGKYGFWRGMVANYNDYTEGGIEVVGVGCITEGDVTVNHFEDARTYVASGAAAISTKCSNPEIALAYMDMYYRDDWFNIVNYGEEGVTYELDENGVPYYTELITNNPDGYTFNNACQLYTTTYFVGYLDTSRYTTTFNDYMLELTALWQTTTDGKNVVPTLNFTPEQSEHYSELTGDISTLVSEQITKYITGEDDISTYDSFLARLDALGIDELIQINQEAYDRYLLR